MWISGANTILRIIWLRNNFDMIRKKILFIIYIYFQPVKMNDKIKYYYQRSGFPFVYVFKCICYARFDEKVLFIIFIVTHCKNYVCVKITGQIWTCLSVFFKSPILSAFFQWQTQDASLHMPPQFWKSVRWHCQFQCKLISYTYQEFWQDLKETKM